MVSEEGYTIDPAEIAPVQALKDQTPSAVGELSRVLGFLSYYRVYIPDFSKMAKPILLAADPASRQNSTTGVKTKREKG